MPIYLYEDGETGEVKEVFQGVHDAHEYSEGGKQWKRIFTVPNASVSSRVPRTKNEFMSVTSEKKGTLGNVMDLSKEMSERRAKEHGGEDPVKRKYYKDYEKQFRMKHPHDRQTKKFSSGVTVSYD